MKRLCHKIASAKIIMSNNGILENEVAVDGVVEQRYWIEFYGNSRRSRVRLAGVLLQDFGLAGTAMQKVLGILNNEKTFSVIEQVQGNLGTDYFAILASVLVKHQVIAHVKEFIKSVD